MDAPSSTGVADRRSQQWRIYGYLVAVLGSVGIAAAFIPFRDALQPSTVALLLVVVVLIAANLGGRGPAWTGAALSFLAFDLLHTTPYYRLKMDQVEELEVALVFAVIALLVGEISVYSAGAREAILRAEFREARVGRVLMAASSGVGRSQLIRMVEHELEDEFGLDTARYEDEPRTTCQYRIDDRGQLFHRGDRLTGDRVHFPGEPVCTEVHTGGRALGQIVLIPERSSRVSEEQLLLAANLSSLLAGLLHEATD